MNKTLELSPETRFSLPHKLDIIEYKDKIIALDCNSANWIVLNCSRELEILNRLKESALGEVYASYPEKDFLNVVTQIVAKNFSSACANKQKGSKYEPSLCLYLTTACNMRCKHCYMYAGSSQQDELTITEILTLLDNFAQAGGKKITLTGGEVAIRKDFKEIVKHARARGLIITVLTNGLLWDKKLIKELKYHIDEVQVSIDGHDEASYNAMRMFGFKKAINCVEQFLLNGYKTTIAITPTIETLTKERKKYVYFALELLKKWKEYPLQIKFSHEMLTGREIELTHVENAHYRTMVELIVEEIYPNDKVRTFALNRKHQPLFKNCGFGELSILSNGDVYYCNRVYELEKQDNIRESDFLHIIERARDAQKAACVDNLIPCNTCAIKYICGGGCRIKHFPELVKNTDFTNNEHYSRKCNETIKNEFYDLMIKANELLFGEYESS